MKKWTYWRWFFVGINGKPGILKFVDRWLPVHVLIATQLAEWTQTSIKDEAAALILPLAGVFIGLSFAWSGNAQALMQSDDLAEVFERHDDGLENYIYTFQNAVLTLLVTISGWGIAGLGVFDRLESLSIYAEFSIKSVLFVLASLSVRECWHVVMGSQFFILMQRNIRKEAKKNDYS